MVTKAKSLTFEKTDSVLEAIIRESLLIKRYQPFYNVDERDDKSDQYVVITDELWPRVFLARARDLEQSQREGTTDFKIMESFGPFTDAGLIKEAMKILRKMFPFRDKKAQDSRHESFYRAIGRSPDRDGEKARESYLQTIKYLILFFEGNKKKLRAKIEKDMKSAIEELRFEDAGRSKRLLYALDHVNDIALIKQKREMPFAEEAFGDQVGGKNSLESAAKKAAGFRIEAYDVAHLSGTNVVGAMTVSMNGQPAKDEYRKFKLSKEQNNDSANLSEILSRRLNHPEWAYPDIIVVDGNEVQMKAAEAVLKARRIGIPIVAVTKDEHHKASKIIGDQDIVSRLEREIVAVNAEAHRFAVAFHRQRRGKGLLM